MRVDISVFGGYLIEINRMREWANAQTDPKFVKIRSENLFISVIIEKYIEYKRWTKHIGVELVPTRELFTPCEQDAKDPRELRGSEWYIVLYRRSRKYHMRFEKFSDWDRFKEHEGDIRIKTILDGIGLKEYGLKDWSVYAWVTYLGLIHNFSPETHLSAQARMGAAKEEADRVKAEQIQAMQASAAARALSRAS
ncbi:hypothetical protein CTheo_6034 [Ceratobasidium theobromae]|uniref:Uncharacterized protein n=1 Tax=Ceratobasidium theobromae TaxID=1582974 RepID=A0A5N5QFM0_9AGAM|nr:hypothetical protein CTheo_6034 [Ceratobasidium theobromae]